MDKVNQILDELDLLALQYQAIDDRKNDITSTLLVNFKLDHYDYVVARLFAEYSQ